MRELAQLITSNRTNPRPLPKVTTAAQRAGVAYEKKVFVALKNLASYLGATVEHNPWFAFVDNNGPGLAVPDVVFTFDTVTIVIEVKLKYIPEARNKLTKLYMPLVMNETSSFNVKGLVICKFLTPNALPTIDTLGDTLTFKNGIPVLPWNGKGKITWK